MEQNTELIDIIAGFTDLVAKLGEYTKKIAVDTDPESKGENIMYYAAAFKTLDDVGKSCNQFKSVFEDYNKLTDLIKEKQTIVQRKMFQAMGYQPAPEEKKAWADEEEKPTLVSAPGAIARPALTASSGPKRPDVRQVSLVNTPVSLNVRVVDLPQDCLKYREICFAEKIKRFVFPFGNTYICGRHCNILPENGKPSMMMEHLAVNMIKRFDGNNTSVTPESDKGSAYWVPWVVNAELDLIRYLPNALVYKPPKSGKDRQPALHFWDLQTIQRDIANAKEFGRWREYTWDFEDILVHMILIWMVLCANGAKSQFMNPIDPKHFK